MSGDWRGDSLNINCNFLYCNLQVHRDFLITLFILLFALDVFTNDVTVVTSFGLFKIFSFDPWAGYRNRYSDCVRAGRSGDRIPVGARFSAPVQTGPEAHPASCTMGTGSFSGLRCCRGVTLTPHPLLVQRSKIE